MRTFIYSEHTTLSSSLQHAPQVTEDKRGTWPSTSARDADAFHTQRFIPYFQPLVELRTGRLAGLEMLARCQHETHGLLLPAAFMPQVESSGGLGELMLDLAVQAAMDFRSLPYQVGLSLNISPLQLRDVDLPRQIRAIAAHIGVSLRCLTVEITETAIAIDDPHCLSTARALKEMGCRLSLDDFGTGYSCLLQLQALPFDEIKIDRQFVGSMLHNPESRKIVSAVIGLGQSLNLRTVAEGVETEQQSEMLRWLGCDIGQGWLYGRPMPAAALRELFERPTPEQRPSSFFHAAQPSLDSPATRLAQLQAIYDGVPVGLAFLDKKLRYLNLNKRMAQMNDCTVEEHLGRTVHEVLPELFPLIEPFLQRALGGEVIHDVELVIEPSKGSPYVRWFSYQPALDRTGEVIGLCIAVSNRNEGVSGPSV